LSKASDTISFTCNSHIIQPVMKTLSNLQILRCKLTSSRQTSCIVYTFLVTIIHKKAGNHRQRFKKETWQPGGTSWPHQDD